MGKKGSESHDTPEPTPNPSQDGNLAASLHKNLPQEDRKKFRFHIEDTGIGITEEDLKEIFSVFQQVGKTSRAIEGSGLGLAISRQLVGLMGAELQVESTPGTGSVFWFDLELPEVERMMAREVKPTHKITGYAGARRRLLIVDDKKKNRDVLLAMLLPLGFDSIEAQNGQECVKQVLAMQPDLILLDLWMPVMDGFEAAKTMRNEE